MDDQDLWGPGDDNLLGCNAVTFAVWAFPDLVTAEHLLLAVASKTLVDITGTVGRYLDADAVKCFVSGGCLATGRALQPTGMLASKER